MSPYDALTGAVLRGIDSSAAAHGWAAESEGPARSGITLIFDTGRLTITNPFTLRCDSGGTVDPQSIIGCCVTASYTTGDRRVWVFDGHIVLAIALGGDDVSGGPAAVFRPDTGRAVVFR